jgi:hypothetical protein
VAVAVAAAAAAVAVAAGGLVVGAVTTAAGHRL